MSSKAWEKKYLLDSTLRIPKDQVKEMMKYDSENFFTIQNELDIPPPNYENSNDYGWTLLAQAIINNEGGLKKYIGYAKKFKHKLQEWERLPFVLQKAIESEPKRKNALAKIFTSVEPKRDAMASSRGNKHPEPPKTRGKAFKQNTEKMLSMPINMLTSKAQPVKSILKHQDDPDSLLDESEIANGSELKKSCIKFNFNDKQRSPDNKRRHRRLLRNRYTSKKWANLSSRKNDPLNCSRQCEEKIKIDKKVSQTLYRNICKGFAGQANPRYDKIMTSPKRKTHGQKILQTRSFFKKNSSPRYRLGRSKEKSFDSRIRREQDSVDVLKEKISKLKAQQKSGNNDKFQGISSDPALSPEPHKAQSFDISPKSSRPKISPYFSRMGPFPQQITKNIRPFLLTKGSSTKIPESLVLTSRRKLK
ncbi:unnamed protein product [Moneuplotes crassus]|uniref:Uncharacterized protein n=1 Tax=Euplotes crassus TaxID=5936 RepID=A0AAD1U863_EUPCR|nr:unnamed protein product [Moneuplotes crassus]